MNEVFKQTEHDIQKQIVAYLRTTGNIVINCDVMDTLRSLGGINADRIRFFSTIRYNKMMGYTEGQSDLVVISRKGMFLLEIKTEKGRQSKEQKEFERRVKELGVNYFIARNISDIKDILNKL